jgi:predicted  nucleic acid-binding Zn-ribbon protein
LLLIAQQGLGADVLAKIENSPLFTTIELHWSTAFNVKSRESGVNDSQEELGAAKAQLREALQGAAAATERAEELEWRLKRQEATLAERLRLADEARQATDGLSEVPTSNVVSALYHGESCAKGRREQCPAHLAHTTGHVSFDGCCNALAEGCA